MIERSLNPNIVHYDAKVLPDGRLDPEQPVVAYWVMGTKGGRRQELNLLERARAFGFSVQPRGADTYALNIVSEKKREFLITHVGDTARAESMLGNCRAVVKRIFVTMRRTLLLNLPESAELYGSDIATGQPCYERVTP